MEKRISYSQFQQVKACAKMIDPCTSKIESLKKKIVPLVEEMKGYQTQIDALEQGIVSVLGFHVSELVKKVIEPTGAVGKDGKPVKVTKYLPTGIVTYDEQKKQYVITVPDTPDTEVPMSIEEASSFHSEGLEGTGTEIPEVVNEPANEQEAEGNAMPWENN